MSEKKGAPKKPDKRRGADIPQSSQVFADILSDPKKRRKFAIKDLLETLPVGVDDKVTTVRAAHHVDKEGFHSAFKSLMSGIKP